MKVILTPKAQRDLEDIGDFIARDNPNRAQSFVDELEAKCLGLADFPLRFPLVTRYANTGLRRCLHHDYLLFYRTEVDQIYVIRILHGSTDYVAILENG